SLDGVNFNDTIFALKTQNNFQHQIKIRFQSNQSNIVYHEFMSFFIGNTNLSDRIYLLAATIEDTKSIRMATWNMKWFGLPSQCGCDTALAKQQALQVFKMLDADIYFMQEVVSIEQFNFLLQQLGSNYDGVLSPYCSQISNTSLPGYQTCQKLGFIFKKSKIENVASFGMFQSTYPTFSNSTSPYWCFSSGRFPFAMKAKVKNNINNDTLLMVNMHAKAYDAIDDYNRRACGAMHLIDTFNTQYSSSKVALMGDYNDLIEGSIVTGLTTSPYNDLFFHDFTGITKPSLFFGQNTYLGSAGGLIDNLMVSNELNVDIIPNSTFIFKEATAVISNFKYTSSDHLPVMTYLKSDISNTVFYEPIQKENKFVSLKNPSSSSLNLVFNDVIKNNIEIEIFDLNGRKVFSKSFITKAYLNLETNLKPGFYFLKIKNENNMNSFKLLIN
nr:T9SS type A sorting domain-containing protein [Chitinophagaceae bacterium]